jgi:hypothetical protein
MADQTTLNALRTRLESLHYGEQGLTRNDMRVQMADLPDAIYLHLPDSKRFRSADEVLYEVRTSAARSEGEFIAADDNTPSDGAEADFGPAGYGDSPLISPSTAGSTTNTPVPGFDGNSLETSSEFPER